MRLAFMGTPDFATPALAALIAAGHDVACVYTRAPQPKGRGRTLQKSAVHRYAEERGLIVRTPPNFKAEADRGAFAALGLDAAVVVAYGVILPAAVLEAPRLGCFNLHASLLPRWRGAAPIQRAIMAGDAATGVQVMRMEAGLDTGPVLASDTVAIAADDTAATLAARLAALGAALLPRALAAVERGAATETPQSAEGILYADKISAAEARIDWALSAEEIDRRIRGLSPFPGAWFEATGLRGPERVKVLMSRVARGSGAPGDVLLSGKDLVVACGSGAVALLTLQRSGKSAQPADEFLRGFAIAEGMRL